MGKVKESFSEFILVVELMNDWYGEKLEVKIIIL